MYDINGNQIGSNGLLQGESITPTLGAWDPNRGYQINAGQYGGTNAWWMPTTPPQAYTQANGWQPGYQFDPSDRTQASLLFGNIKNLQSGVRYDPNQGWMNNWLQSLSTNNPMEAQLNLPAQNTFNQVGQFTGAQSPGTVSYIPSAPPLTQTVSRPPQGQFPQQQQTFGQIQAQQQPGNPTQTPGQVQAPQQPNRMQSMQYQQRMQQLMQFLPLLQLLMRMYGRQ